LPSGKIGRELKSFAGLLLSRHWLHILELSWEKHSGASAATSMSCRSSSVRLARRRPGLCGLNARNEESCFKTTKHTKYTNE
jgi:hypothetical protein